ncbi:hypothetical protein BKA83DRAFT_4168528 [Pisolithus microcarpus]|nr:hypothetical protein BKA83DRAFT_4168528 [Pisolithus microcarpus]
MPPSFTMLSKRLILAWAFFTLCLMAGRAVVTLVLSIVWRQPNLLRNLTFSNFDLTAGTVLGIILLGTSVLSIILINGIAILVIATFIWIFTLHERNNYHAVFGRQSNATKIMIQDTVLCCGYFNATDEVAFAFCVTPIVQFADKRLNNVFSTIYGFMAIKRQESERFEKIDTKRASRFV